jgi:hypothetical protein
MLISARDSLLDKAATVEVCADPFPHVVIRQALRQDLCERLMAEYPPVQLITRRKSPGSNKRFSYPARHSLAESVISQTWREFVEMHISRGFWRQVLDLFRPHILARYPDLARDRGGVEEWRSGVRGLHTLDSVDIILDAQICLNTPVVDQPSSVRGPHVDETDKLFAGLFYLRPQDDRSQGGDLQLLRFKGPVGGFRGVYVDEKHLEVAKVIPYENNLLVLFLNSERAVHAVTPRQPTATPRWLFNLLGVAYRPLYSLDPFQIEGEGPAEPRASAPARATV